MVQTLLGFTVMGHFFLIITLKHVLASELYTIAFEERSQSANTQSLLIIISSQLFISFLGRAAGLENLSATIHKSMTTMSFEYDSGVIH
jgi:hypothetical protein